MSYLLPTMMLMQNLTLVVTKRITLYGGPWIFLPCNYFWMPMTDELVTTSSLFLPLYLTPFLIPLVLCNGEYSKWIPPLYCTVCIYVQLYIHVCPVPVPGVENIVIFLVSSWVRGKRLLTSSKMGKARTEPFFSQQFVPNFWSTLFRGTKNTAELHSVFVEIMDEGRERDKTSSGGGLPTLPGLYLSTFQSSQRGFFRVHTSVWREREPEFEFSNF